MNKALQMLMNTTQAYTTVTTHAKTHSKTKGLKIISVENIGCDLTFGILCIENLQVHLLHFYV